MRLQILRSKGCKPAWGDVDALMDEIEFLETKARILEHRCIEQQIMIARLRRQK